MSTNPYESPRSDATDSLPLCDERAVAKRNVRIALLIMLAPAIYNFICFNFPANPNRFRSPIFLQAVNGIGFVTIVIAIWCLGLAMLECMFRYFIDGTKWNVIHHLK